ncbi:hypothetical protein KAR91_09345 [Candidatus Pacearchaeota archaeon]|nr:hypothetical protein [Candidatus Pacearchaeota archaeon]
MSTEEDKRAWYRAQRDAINSIIEKWNETFPENTIPVIDWRALKASHMNKVPGQDTVMDDIPEVE